MKKITFFLAKSFNNHTFSAWKRVPDGGIQTGGGGGISTWHLRFFAGKPAPTGRPATLKAYCKSDYGHDPSPAQ